MSDARGKGTNPSAICAVCGTNYTSAVCPNWCASMKPIARLTDRNVMKGIAFTVTVQFKRTWRGRFGLWLLQRTTKLCAWLMNCAIEVKQP